MENNANIYIILNNIRFKIQEICAESLIMPKNMIQNVFPVPVSKIVLVLKYGIMYCQGN